eukprot:755947-Hanusia_phi.AAC.1
MERHARKETSGTSAMVTKTASHFKPCSVALITIGNEVLSGKIQVRLLRCLRGPALAVQHPFRLSPALNSPLAPHASTQDSNTSCACKYLHSLGISVARVGRPCPRLLLLTTCRSS